GLGRCRPRDGHEDFRRLAHLGPLHCPEAGRRGRRGRRCGGDSSFRGRSDRQIRNRGLGGPFVGRRVLVDAGSGPVAQADCEATPEEEGEGRLVRRGDGWRRRREIEEEGGKAGRGRDAGEEAEAALLERIARAVQQRMYLVERHKRSDVEEEFAVLGSTGNVRRATPDPVAEPSGRSSLPGPEQNASAFTDFTKGNLCKHIFFVNLKVLRLSRDSPLLYQAGLLTSELCAVFANAIPDPAAVANEMVRNHYKRLKSGGQPGEDSNRKQVEGDCPIW
ncbi:MAG: hypothetical protein BJ554DRAFT_7847, partial [Olpidium bornovanus]